MNGGATTTAIDAVLDVLKRNLSHSMVSAYLYGSLSGGTYQAGQSDINLLVILDEQETIHHVRNILRPVWRQHSLVLKRTPLLMTPTTFSRHLSFNPGLTHHLVEHGSLLSGRPCLPEPQTHDVFERLSQLARIAMHGSAALAPSLLSDRERSEAILSLRSLTRQLFGLEVNDQERATSLFGNIQADLSRRLSLHPSLDWTEQQIDGAPPLVQDLQAIYENDNRLILLLPDSGPESLATKITEIDWDAVASRVTGQYRGLWVTTPSQLRLILRFDSPAGYHLGSYNHAWGIEPIANLQVESWRIFRNFGRMPSTLQVDTFPQAYINSEDSDLAMLVHDLHNKLLNVQLQNELFCRMEGLAIAKPPEKLLDRHLPIENRIDSIYDHLDFWTAYYEDHMMAAKVQIA